MERDLELLEKEGVDLVWAPTAGVMYPKNFQTWVNVEAVTKLLEGAMRPGHFKGVTTVVAKLFNAVQPNRAYFGQKDAQQAIVIRQMAKDLNFPIEIVICPIIREADGLAMSSRNTYLSPNERKAARVLYRALTEAQTAYQQGERQAEHLRAIMTEVINSEPLARLQYISCADPDTLEELQGQVDRALLSMAVYVGNTRLIDNLIVKKD
jgi:pantoate--beta-alanine ligase